MSVRELLVKFGGEVDRSLPRSAQEAAGQIGVVETKVSRSSKVMGGLKKAGSGALKVVGGAVAGLGLAVAGAGAVAAKAGWDRLVGIDNARAKLTGLGHDATATQLIMDNAMASVRGTAFGMGDAAGLAGQIVAAGVKPGKDLQRVLSLVGDTATIAGADLGEMGNIFSKVAGVGKLTGESMAQLSERGIPVLQWLAKEYGISTEAAQKMVSKGKVSFEQFSGIIEKNIGGAAKASGDTMQGAMANARAALGRLGARFLEPMFSKGAGAFKAITEQIDKLGPAAEAAGKWVGSVIDGIGGVWSILGKGEFDGSEKTFGLEEDSKIVGWLFDLRDGISGVRSILGQGDFQGKTFGLEEDSKIVGWLFDVRDTAIAARDGLSDLWAGFTLGADDAEALGDELDGLVGVGRRAREWADQMKVSLSDLWAGFTLGKDDADALGDDLEGLVGIGRDLRTSFDGIAEGVKTALGLYKEYALAAVAGFRENVMPALRDLGGAVMGFVETVRPIISEIVAWVMERFREWGPTIGGYLKQISEIFMEYWQLITAIVGKYLGMVQTRVQQVTAVIKWIWDRWGSGIMATASAVFGSIVKVIGGALNVVQGIIRTVMGIVTGDWGKAWDGIKQIVRGAFGIVKNIFEGGSRIMNDLTRAAAGLVISGFEWLRDKVTEKATQAKDWVVDKFTKMKTGIVDLFTGIGDTIGKKFDGIKDGIAKPLRSAASWLNENILSPMNNVTSKFGVTIPQLPKFHQGGEIPGRGEKPIMALGGEGVLTRDAMRRIGGRQGLDSLNKGVGGLLDWIRKPADWVADVARNGVAWGLGKLFGASGMAEFEPPMAGDLLRGTIGTMKAAALAWARGKDEAEKAAAATSTTATLPGGRAWPANTRALSGNYPGHSGVDIAAGPGTPIFAAASGPITYAGWGRGYGQAIFQSVGGGLQAVYGHSSRVRVQSGQNVVAGQQIGDVGSTGNSSGPHLHYEINSPGGFGTPANRQATLRWLGFDQGGWLPPGQTMTVNNSGRPEAILTADQWERLLGALEAMAAGDQRAVVDGASLRDAIRSESTRAVATHRKKVLA